MKNRVITLWLRLRGNDDVELYEPPEPVFYVTKVVITRQTRSGKTTFSQLHGEGDDLTQALVQALGRSKTQFRQVADVLAPLVQEQQERKAVENEPVA